MRRRLRGFSIFDIFKKSPHLNGTAVRFPQLIYTLSVACILNHQPHPTCTNCRCRSILRGSQYLWEFSQMVEFGNILMLTHFSEANQGMFVLVLTRYSPQNIILSHYYPAICVFWLHWINPEALGRLYLNIQCNFVYFLHSA